MMGIAARNGRRGTPALAPWTLGVVLAGVSCDAVSGIDGLRFAQSPGAFCESSADCGRALFCDVTVRQCSPVQALGAPCEVPEACESGLCEEGTCCETACTGACLSCNLASAPGVCQAVLAGDDPEGGCPGAATCGEGGICQGALRWALGLGDANDQQVTALAVAPGTAGLRDTFVAGTFAGTMRIGPFELVATGARDVFLARISGEGTALWARSLAADDAVPTSAAFDAGAIYVAGSFTGPLTIDTVHVAEDRDSFVFALDPSGNHRWTTIVGGAGDQAIADASLDGQRLALAGRHDGPLTIGADVFPGTGGDDGWLATLRSDDGGLEQAASFGDIDDQAAVAVALDGDTLAVAFDGAGVIDLGTGPIGGSSGDVDTVIASLDATSWAPRWGIRVGGDASSQRTIDVVVGGDGAVWATGWTDGDVQSTFAFDHTSGRDALLLRLDQATGSPLAIPLVGPSDVMPAALARTSAGVIVVGGFDDRLDVGDDTLDTNGAGDGFVVEVANQGTVRWATTFGGTLDDEVVAAAADAFDVLVAGTFEHRLEAAVPPLWAEGERDGFVARMAR